MDSQSPTAEAGSAIGLAYDDGIVIAADTLVSYGYAARYRDCPRVHKLNSKAIIGCGGDYADFQRVWQQMEQKQIEEEYDGHSFTPKSLHSWLTRVNYNRRINFDPYWVEWIVGGIQDGKPYLGYSDKLGTGYQDTTLATGRYGSLARTLLREATEGRTTPLNKQDARDVIVKCMKSLYYRAAWSVPKYYIGFVSRDSDAVVEGPFELETNWDAMHLTKGYE